MAAAGVLAALLAGLLFLEWLLPLRTAVKIGADEGFELAEATLCAHGYHLYTQIWDDQPPLDTALITRLVEHVSPSVLGPRLLTVGWTLLLLSAVFLAVHRVHGLLAAALATGLLIASPGFLELSCSAMQEIPALAPALAALAALLTIPPRRWRIAELAAGAVFAVALQMKFIGLIYLPLAALILRLRCGPAEKPGFQNGRDARPATPPSLARRLLPREALAGGLVFLGALTGSFLLLNWLLGETSYWLQLRESWAAHFAPPKSFEYGSPDEHRFDGCVLLRNWDTTVPALIGVVACLKRLRQQPAGALPVAWLGLTLVVFAAHTPWWSYYYVHNAVPLCWCAAIGLSVLFKRIRQRASLAPRIALALSCLAALIWMGARAELQVRGIRRSPQLYSDLILQQVKRFKPFTRFLYTDEPVYSFHADIPLPPQLGVISLKRFWSGNLSNARLAEILRRTRPGLLLLANSTRELPFTGWMNANYRLVYEDPDHRLFAANSVLEQARQSRAEHE